MIRPSRAAGIALLGALLGSFIRAEEADREPLSSRLTTPWTRRVDTEFPHPEYPRPQLRRREWQGLNGRWQFAVASENETPPTGRKLGGTILVPFPIQSPLSGIAGKAEHAWYRRGFTIPPEWLTQRVLLHFGGVDRHSRVWVNGEQVGEHRGSYDAFTYDITDVLTPAGEQELIVGVQGGKRPAQGGRHDTVKGIWRSVWLEPVPLASIAALELVPNLRDGKLLVTVRGRGTGRDHEVRLVAVNEGQEVASAQGELEESIELQISQPRSWTPDDPFLYDLRVSLHKGENELDEVRSYFGLRDVAVGPDENGTARLLLNGKPRFLFGVVDQGFWPDGFCTAPTDEALRADIERIKSLGFNLVRKDAKIEPARWYYWCDRLGLIVWQEMPKSVGEDSGDNSASDETSGPKPRAELERLVQGYRNHPCITAWILWNGSATKDSPRLTEEIKRLDPARLVCVRDPAGGGDFVSFQEVSGPVVAAVDRAEGDGRAAVLGRFGGIGLAVDEHVWSDEHSWGHREVASGDELFDEYARQVRSLRFLIDEDGLAAAVYSQATDVETEVDGLTTYDRRHVKVDVENVRELHRELFRPPPRLRVLAPLSGENEASWLVTEKKPGDGWTSSDFDRGTWKKLEAAPAGTEGSAGTAPNPDSTPLWLSRIFALPAATTANLQLRLFHSGDLEVHVNGHPLPIDFSNTSRRGFVDHTFTDEEAAWLQAGENIISVRCTLGTASDVRFRIAEVLPADGG